MDDSGLSEKMRSATEPSTPLRSNIRIEGSFANYSQPRRRSLRTNDIHLPPHELPSITAKLSQESMSAPGSLRRIISRQRLKTRPRTRPTTPLNRPELTSRLSGMLTPTRNSSSRKRRSSGEYFPGSIRRKRRSIIMTEKGDAAFDPNYIGPITIDYLRLFCRVLIEEKERPKRDSITKDCSNRASIEVPVIKDLLYEPDRKSESKLPGDFDQSLPLPHDEDELPLSIFLNPHIEDDEPEETFKNEREDTNHFVETIRPAEPVRSTGKTFSYLERILAAQASKNKYIDENAPKEVSLESHNTHFGEENMISTVEPSKFVIEDNSAHINKYTGGLYDIETPTKTLRDSVGSTIEKKLGNDIESHAQTPMDIEEFGQDKQNEDFLNNNYNDIDNTFETPSHEAESKIKRDYKGTSIAHSPSTLTATSIANEAVSELEGFVQDQPVLSTDISPSAVINEEYTFNNDQDINILEDPLEVGNHLIDDFNNEEDLHDNINGKKGIRISTLGNLTIKNKQDSKSIPITMVKNLVKHLQTAPIDDQIRNPPNVKRLAPDIYGFIQLKSNEFIQSVVSDLEAYSRHRTKNKSSQINIRDVLLYLNRIRFARTNKKSEIENITRLANDFLPLELLISLDNNLHGLVDEQKPTDIKLGYFSDVSESDESEYIDDLAPKGGELGNNVRHLRAFSESDTD